MTLTRVWTPTQNYSSRGSYSVDLLVIHDMEGFTGENGAYDCACYFQGDVGASSHVCIDNNRGKIWECVNRVYASWTQCEWNKKVVSAELGGYASWSRQYWLDNRENELRNAAEWVAEEAAYYDIPIRALTASEAQNGGRGIVQHRDLGSTGCGHADCGDGFPMDQVIEWAKGGPEQIGGIVVAGVEFDSSGRPWEVGSWKDNGQLNFKIGNNPFAAIDKTQTGAIGSPGIAYNPVDRQMRVVYINASGKMCAYTTDESPINWHWSELGGSFQG